jgi:hypothetical protein
VTNQARDVFVVFDDKNTLPTTGRRGFGFRHVD